MFLIERCCNREGPCGFFVRPDRKETDAIADVQVFEGFQTRDRRQRVIGKFFATREGQRFQGMFFPVKVSIALSVRLRQLSR